MPTVIPAAQAALLLVTAAVVLVACAATPVVSPAPTEADATALRSPRVTSRPVTEQTLGPTPSTTPASSAPPIVDRIRGDRLGVHVAALQAAADANGGTRATGTAGHAASVAYVVATLSAVGYEVVELPFASGRVRGVNLVAERTGDGTTDEIVLLGAHLDSVRVGPGMNDNASGVAAVLEIAVQMAATPPGARTVRFALWDAEEGGPHGSAAYLAGLSREERERIVAYLNLDMIGSPNPLRLVYAEADAPAGSEAITARFSAHFDAAGLPWEPVDLQGGSDHGPFVAAGIPVGGLFSGGIEPVTEAQAARFGATAGVPADACSHRSCDTIDNVDLQTLEEMARAAAAVLEGLAAAP